MNATAQFVWSKILKTGNETGFNDTYYIISDCIKTQRPDSDKVALLF